MALSGCKERIIGLPTAKVTVNLNAACCFWLLQILFQYWFIPSILLN